MVLTSKEIQKIQELRNNGETLDTIVSITGHSKTTVAKYCKSITTKKKRTIKLRKPKSSSPALPSFGNTNLRQHLHRIQESLDVFDREIQRTVSNKSSGWCKHLISLRNYWLLEYMKLQEILLS
jgi:hypothetical protein